MATITQTTNLSADEQAARDLKTQARNAWANIDTLVKWKALTASQRDTYIWYFLALIARRWILK